MHFYRALIIYSCFIDTYGEKKQKVTTHTLTHTVVNLGILLGFFVCFFFKVWETLFVVSVSLQWVGLTDANKNMKIINVD